MPSNHRCCWGCGCLLERGDAISISGDFAPNETPPSAICTGCRDKLPMRDRILLNALLRSREQGGIGAVDALEQIVQLISLSIEAAGNGNQFWGRVTGQGDTGN